MHFSGHAAGAVTIVEVSHIIYKNDCMLELPTGYLPLIVPGRRTRAHRLGAT
jgi:hypothetical protein